MSSGDEFGDVRRENCEYFSEGYCRFYKFDCFHDNSSPFLDSRCNKLMPLTQEETMPWMRGCLE